MTRPRPSLAERRRIARQQRAETEERQMAFIEHRLAALGRLATQATMLKIAHARGRLSEARATIAEQRLREQLKALRELTPDPYDPPAMKS